jgi:hypothetical protein
MLDVRSLVPMDEGQANKLAEASAAKASELKAAREVIASRFAGQKRISLDTVLKELDGSIAEYASGADPSYWTNPAPAPAQAEATPTVDTPANLDATQVVTEASPEETTPKGRSRR